MPPSGVRWLARGLGLLVYLFDVRGRRVGIQNLNVAFGETLSRAAKRRLLRHSVQGMIEAILVLLHASPFTPSRVRRWIDVDAAVARRIRDLASIHDGGVLVSGHYGSWELLLGLLVLFPGVRHIAFFVRPVGIPAVDAFLERLRYTGETTKVLRRGGARRLIRHVEAGGVAGILADRNVRPTEGGVWAPFLGLEAATTTLPARIARRTGTPVVPVFCEKIAGGRYRLELGEDLTRDLPIDDPDAFDQGFAVRWNAVLEARIRETPEAWNWTFMRFKSRPSLERGRYPPYSGWRGPDPWEGSPVARTRRPPAGE